MPSVLLVHSEKSFNYTFANIIFSHDFTLKAVVSISDLIIIYLKKVFLLFKLHTLDLRKIRKLESENLWYNCELLHI